MFTIRMVVRCKLMFLSYVILIVFISKINKIRNNCIKRDFIICYSHEKQVKTDLMRRAEVAT